MKNAMKRKTTLLFVCYGLGIGGIEKCLVNLINAMPEHCDIDVLLMNPQYNFRNQITRPVRFLETFDYVMNIEDTPGEITRRKGLWNKGRMIINYCLFRLRIKLRRNAWIGFKPLPGEYDIAVAYSHHDFSPYYVIDKVKAKKKIMWYHNGAYEQTGRRYDRDKRYYTAFDHVVAVSTDCANVLSEKFSFREGQLLVLRNICAAEAVHRKAEEFVPDSFSANVLNIVTIGRMTAEKGALIALEACKLLADRGYDIHWHWVGSGNQEQAVLAKCAELGLNDRFLLEGNQDNPYPYLYKADVYVQPSYYEAYSTTVTEARVLHKPIVTTDVGGMRDQITDGVNGLIVPIDAAAVADAVAKLADSEVLRHQFTKELKHEDFRPEIIMEEYTRTVFA